MLSHPTPLSEPNQGCANVSAEFKSAETLTFHLPPTVHSTLQAAGFLQTGTGGIMCRIPEPGQALTGNSTSLISPSLLPLPLAMWPGETRPHP